MRLDQALAVALPEYSRTQLQRLLKNCHLYIDGQVCRVRTLVSGGETVSGGLILESDTLSLAQDIPLDILYQDADLLIVNKPAGLVVHPAVGNTNGTLVNALLYYRPELANLPRAGLVHRLDKDTSGLLVVACSLRAHSALVKQLSEHCIEREYLAIVNGIPVAGGTIDAPIGRHPVNRQRMAVTIGGKPAVTHFEIKRRFHIHALLRVRLETGRTHQIRVHMAHLRFPLLGDPVYGKRICLPRQASPYSIGVIRNFQRQALHAEWLSLTHPVTGKKLKWRAELPGDLVELLDALE